MLKAARNCFEETKILRLRLVYAPQILIDRHGRKSSFPQKICDSLGVRSAGEINPGKNALVCPCKGRWRNGSHRFQQSGDPFHEPFGDPLVHEITIDDQQFSAGLQDPQPLVKAGLWIDECPDKVTGDDYVIAFVRFQSFFRVAEMKANGTAARRCLGTRQLQHRFRPVDARHVVAEIIHQVRNYAGATCKVERPAAFAASKMFFDKPVPSRPFIF